MDKYTDRAADWSIIPERMIDGLKRYIERGIAPGHFLTAVLTNDLREACRRADDENQRLIFEYIKFLYNYAPAGCWGSPQQFAAWIKQGGLMGHVTESANARNDVDPAS